MAEIEYYLGTDEPIPDGKRMLVLKVNPFWDAVGEDPQKPTTVTLNFSEYKSFRFGGNCSCGCPHSEDAFLRATHNDGYVESFSLSNILYMVMTPNSPPVVEALNAWHKKNRQTKVGR